jgi:hypothetical protein
VIILVRDPRFEVGDFIEATYTGQSPGLPDVVMTVGGNVQADEFGDPVRVVLEIPNDKVVSVQTVSVAYVLKRNGEQQYSSREAKARVVGEGLPDLVPPTVLTTSVNGVLDPMQNLQGATGRVEVQGWRTGDTVRLIVQGAPGAGSPVFTSKPLNTNNRANFPLEVAFINANMGGQPVKFSYVFTRGGQEYPSPSTDITVSRIADGDTRLPTPAIDGAVGNELDVTNLQVSDQLRVVAWPLQQLGQRVWLRYDVKVEPNEAPIFFEDLKGEPHNTLGDLTRPAPLDWLKTLEDGSELTITFRVNFDGVANGATAVGFPVRMYIVKTTGHLTGYEGFDLEPDGLVLEPNSPYTTKNGVTVTVVSKGTFDTNFQFNSFGSGAVLKAATLSKIRLKFGRGFCRNVNFAYTQNSSASSPTTARYYDENNNMLGSETLDVHVGSPFKKLSFASALDISYMELWVGTEGGGTDSGMHFDDLEWF